MSDDTDSGAPGTSGSDDPFDQFSNKMWDRYLEGIETISTPSEKPSKGSDPKIPETKNPDVPVSEHKPSPVVPNRPSDASSTPKSDSPAPSESFGDSQSTPAASEEPGSSPKVPESNDDLQGLDHAPEQQRNTDLPTSAPADVVKPKPSEDARADSHLPQGTDQGTPAKYPLAASTQVPSNDFPWNRGGFEEGTIGSPKLNQDERLGDGLDSTSGIGKDGTPKTGIGTKASGDIPLEDQKSPLDGSGKKNPVDREVPEGRIDLDGKTDASHKDKGSKQGKKKKEGITDKANVGKAEQDFEDSLGKSGKDSSQKNIPKRGGFSLSGSKLGAAAQSANTQFSGKIKKRHVVAGGAAVLLLAPLLLSMTGGSPSEKEEPPVECAPDSGGSILSNLTNVGGSGEVSGDTVIGKDGAIPSNLSSKLGHEAGVKERMEDAAVIMGTVEAVGKEKKLTESQITRLKVITLITAIQESGLQNLDYGDRDSLGYYQQRPSQAWGSREQVTDPVYSTTAFLNGAGTNQGVLDKEGWETKSPGEVSQSVQLSAFPGAYTEWIPGATWIIQNVSGKAVEGLDISGVGSDGSGCAGLAGNNMEDCSPTTKWAQLESNLKPDGVLVLRCVSGKYPDLFNPIGGYRPGPDAYSDDHGNGLAIDFMVPNFSDDAQIKKVDGAVAWMISNHTELGIKYIIWRQKIWNSERQSEGWRSMEDRGSPTQNHMDHPHVSVYGNKGTGMKSESSGGSGKWAAPLKKGDYQITSEYGMRLHPKLGIYRLHAGLDFGSTKPQPNLYAVDDATVKSAGDCGGCGFGNLVEIQTADGVLLKYAHLSSVAPGLNPGDKVKRGQKIGNMGTTGLSTGEHLHLETWVKNNSQDPRILLKKNGVSP